MANHIDISSAVSEVVNNFTGKRIALPNGQREGDSIAPVVAYISYLGALVPQIVNERSDGWGSVFPHELDLFFAPEPFESGKAYPRGTILMWDTPHIAIVMYSDGGSTVSVFEQTASAEIAYCRQVNRAINDGVNSCTYALVPIADDALPPVEAPPEPVVEDPEPVEESYKVPTGGLGFNKQEVKLYIKVPINTYPSPIAASSKTKPKDKKLNPGTVISDLHKMGMLRIKTDQNDETWINPSENVVAPTPSPIEKLIPAPKNRLNSYQAFDGPRRYTATSTYMRVNREADGQNFQSGTTFPIKYGLPVDIAGTFVEGDFWYGVPAKMQPDGTYRVFKGLGILMSYLVLSQEEYKPEERRATPRSLTMSDHITHTKARIAKLLMTL